MIVAQKEDRDRGRAYLTIEDASVAGGEGEGMPAEDVAIDRVV